MFIARTVCRLGFTEQGIKIMASKQKQPVQVIAVTSGKAGVGKTNVSVNLSIALAALGRKVVLLDTDFGLANVDVLLGLRPIHTLTDVMDGKCDLRDVLLPGPSGILIAPAASGPQSMVDMTPMQYAGLIQAFSQLDDHIDVLVIDTAAGLGESVIRFVQAAQEVIMVVCDEPTSITYAYELIKLLNRNHGVTRFRVLANMSHSPQEGLSLFNKLVNAAERFLDDVTLQYLGAIPYDELVRKAAQRQRAVYDAFPRANCSLVFKAMAQQIDSWPLPSSPRGHLEFFVERLICYAETE